MMHLIIITIIIAVLLLHGSGVKFSSGVDAAAVTLTTTSTNGVWLQYSSPQLWLDASGKFVSGGPDSIPTTDDLTLNITSDAWIEASNLVCISLSIAYTCDARSLLYRVLVD